MMTTQVVFYDGGGLAEAADDPDSQVVIDVDKHERGVWFAIENVDGECSCFLSRENWDKIKAAVEAAFT